MIHRCLADLCGWFVTSRIEKAMYWFSRSLHSSAVINSRASLVAQMVKNLPVMWETQVQSLGQEDPLEEEMATHSHILVCKIPWPKEPGRLQPMGSQRVEHDWVTDTFHFHFSPFWGHKLSFWLQSSRGTLWDDGSEGEAMGQGQCVNEGWGKDEYGFY